MGQDVTNNDSVANQINVGSFNGSINVSSKTRLQRKFERLQEEVRSDSRYDSFIEDFNTYNTITDGIGLEKKLKDAGFSERELLKALALKEKYSKRVVLGEMYLTQQEIDVDIFSLIDTAFEVYVYPKIVNGEDRFAVKECLMEKVVDPIIELLNRDGENDDFLNYNTNDIYGMVYFLTGKCHLNWKDYDSI